VLDNVAFSSLDRFKPKFTAGRPNGPMSYLHGFLRTGKIILPFVMAHVEIQMDAALIQSALVEVLQNIQATSELECPPLVGGMRPIEELPMFDSKIWPVAIGMLGASLGSLLPMM